jgi:hypothetical protein
MAKDEKVQEPQTTTGFGISPAQLQEILQTVVKAAKEPNEYEKKKLDDIRRKELAEQKGKEVSIIATHAAKIAKLYNCPHEKEDGRHNFVAQVHADGLVRPVCQICGSTFPPFKASADMVTSGVNLQSKELQKRLKKEHLMAMHKQSFPDCQEHCCDVKKRSEELRKSAEIIAQSGKSIAEAARI